MWMWWNLDKGHFRKNLKKKKIYLTISPTCSNVGAERRSAPEESWNVLWELSKEDSLPAQILFLIYAAFHKRKSRFSKENVKSQHVWIAQIFLHQIFLLAPTWAFSLSMLDYAFLASERQSVKTVGGAFSLEEKFHCHQQVPKLD